mgnify:FL=1
MKKVIISMMFLWIAFSSVQATSYMKLWINGSESFTMVQGDYFA